MLTYRTTGKLVLSAACAALMNICHAAAGPEPVFIGAFDVGPQGNAQKFNPLTASSGFGFYNKYFNTLTLYDAGFQKIGGDLADSWSYSKDGKSLSFRLRKDVRWHDGTPFTAQDVKFTLGLVKDPEMASTFAVRLTDVTDIKVSDPHTVTLVLNKMDVSLPDALTSIMILPQHLLAKYSAKELRNSDWWKNPVGTGPFKWSRYLPDRYVELTANPDYFRGKPRLAKIINRYFRDSSSAAIALAAGEIQYTYLTLDQVRENASTKGFNVLTGPSQVLNYIGFNNNDARFKDLRVRQALLLAIDRSAIIKNIYGNSALLGQCILTLPKYVPADIKHYESNVGKARALLDAAGWSKTSRGEALELLTYYNDQVSKDAITTMQAMLAQAGINIRPRFVDAPSYSQLVDAGKFSLVFAGAGNGPDPGMLMPLLHSAYAPPMGVNRMHVSIPELDALFATAQAETSEARRTEIYRQMCRITNAQLPWIPLWEANRYGGFAKSAQNIVWTPAPGGGRYQESLEKWTLN